MSRHPELDVRRAQVLDAAHVPPDQPTMPAVLRYTGVLYGELDWKSLTPAAKRRGGTAVYIASGMWGLSAPSDPLPFYKLKMMGSLPKLGKLSTWWRPALTDLLRVRLDRRVVWDLLPIEHSAAWLPAEVAYRRRVVVRFVDGSGNSVTHWSKLLKGSLARHLLETGASDPEDLGAWRHRLGYELDPTSSDLAGDPNRLVFRQS